MIFKIRDELCRVLEHEFYLTIDNGRDPYKIEPNLSDNAVRQESHTGEESFETYARGQHDEIMESVQNAKSWEDIHRAFAIYSMEVKPHGNGLVIKNRHGRQSMKASAFNRSMSYTKLCKLFGKFTPMEKEVHDPATKKWTLS